MALNSYLSKITLNVNRQNALIKRNRISEWIRKKNTHLYAVYKRLILGLMALADWQWGGMKQEQISDVEDKIMENSEAKKRERKVLDHECRFREFSNSSVCASLRVRG